MGNKKRNKFKSMGMLRRERAMAAKVKAQVEIEAMARLAPWTPFLDVTAGSTPGYLEAAYGDRAADVRVYRNSRYVVFKVPVQRPAPGEPYTGWWELSIRTVERDARHDWREFQRIKNELCGPEFEAVELYPAESRLLDSANQYYLFVLPKGQRAPFGFDERLVCDVDPTGTTNQRPFEPGTRPPDAVVASVEEHLRKLRARRHAERTRDDDRSHEDRQGDQVQEGGQGQDDQGDQEVGRQEVTPA